MPFQNLKIAVVIPAYNEQSSVGRVVGDLLALKHADQALIDDIVVCDNASIDDTAAIAVRAGARVVHEPAKGYGAACLSAISCFADPANSTPDIVVFIDADNSVDPNEVIELVEKVANGSDLVVGSRNNVLLQKGALSTHQRFGNALASILIRLIWKQKVTDLGPFRAITHSRLIELDMQDKRFGWTVEMQIKTLQAGFRYSEVPVTTRVRIGVSKISGTLSGTIGAAIGIFGKVFQLYLHEREFIESVNSGQGIQLTK